MTPTPTERILDLLHARDANVRRQGHGHTARCPSHDDRHNSLKVDEGANGEALIHCHAGCPPDKVLGALGLRMRDLFPPNGRHDRGSNGTRSRRMVATYNYHDADGTLIFQAVRYEPKGFAQRRPDGRGGWIFNLDGIQPVLYRLPELLAADPRRGVFVCEGEKDVDALIGLGLTATTSPMGAGKWRPDYAEALRGRHVVLLPDNDDPGRAHMAEVARSLHGVAKSVRIVDLAGLPTKGDVTDWLAGGGTKKALLALAQDATVWEPNREANPGAAAGAPSSPREEVPAFPVEVFPQALRRYVGEGAAALGVPADMIALPLLGFAAAAIGNTRALVVKSGWTELPILWLAVIGQPGSGKSPALTHARRPLDALQQAAWARHQDELEWWEAQVAAAKAAKERSAPPPEKPTLEHFFTTDATTEALAAILAGSPGVALVRDELVGWVRSHDAYRKAGDRQSYLSLWAGASLKVDRKGTGTLFVPRPCVPVVGGIQPDLLSDMADEANRRDGFVDRLLMVWPAAGPGRWNEATVDPATLRGAEEMFARLRVTGRPDLPVLTRFTAGAKRVFAAWFDENACLVDGTSGLAAGCFSKYPGQLARLALVLHVLHHPDEPDRSVDADTVGDAICLIEHLRAHLARILPSFKAEGTTRGAGLSIRVMRLLQRAGGEWVSRTDLHRGLGGKTDAADLAAVLETLAAEGQVEHRTVATGAKARQESRWCVLEREEKDEDMKHSAASQSKSSNPHIFGKTTIVEGAV